MSTYTSYIYIGEVYFYTGEAYAYVSEFIFNYVTQISV